LGSRTPGNFRDFSGKSRATSWRVRSVQQTIQAESATIVAQTAIDVLGITYPAIGALIATYRVSKVAYQVVNAANKEYERTGDANKAVSAAAKTIVKTAIGETRDEAIGTIVEVGWSSLKKTAGIHTNELTDRILTSAVKNTLDEVMPN